MGLERVRRIGYSRPELQTFYKLIKEMEDKS